MLARHSGLQKEVFSLFRKLLRIARDKDRAALPQPQVSSDSSKELFTSFRQNDSTSTYYACHEFRRQANQVKRNDFKRIEYMIRKGEKHLKVLKMPGVQTVGGA